MKHLERAAIDGDVLGRPSILSHGVCLSWADGSPILLTGKRQIINLLFQTRFSM